MDNYAIYLLKCLLWSGILIIATIIIVGALRGKKAKQEEVKAEVTSTLYNPIQPKLDVQLLTPNPYSKLL